MSPGTLLSRISLCVFILFLVTACSRHSITDVASCDVLAKKRIVKTGTGKQPKIKKNTGGKSFGHSTDIASSLSLHTSGLPNKEEQNNALTSSHISAGDNALVEDESTAIGSISWPEEKNISREMPGLNSLEAKPVIKIPPNPNFLSPEKFHLGGLAGISTLLSLLMFRVFKSKLMKISAWAAHHPLAGRGIIAGVQIGSSLAALLAGKYLYQEGMIISTETLITASGIFLGAQVLYPMRARTLSTFSHQYFRQKMYDVMLYTSSIAMVASASNQYYHRATPLSTMSVYHHLHSTQENQQQKITTASFVQDENSPAKDSPKKTKRNKVGLKILVITLFVILTLGVAALSCVAICNNQIALAVLLFTLGEGLLILLLITSLRNIKRKQESEKPQSRRRTRRQRLSVA